MPTYEDIRKANASIQTTEIGKKAYAEVNQRIKAFRMVYPEGTIETEMVSNVDGVCIFKATVKNVDIVLGTGYAYEKEGSSFINKTSYIENCETSAAGRALGMAGFGIDTSVASYEEVANAIENQGKPSKGPVMPEKASKKDIEYISTNATDNELKTIVGVYGVPSLEMLTADQARKCIMAINKRKMEENHAK